MLARGQAYPELWEEKEQHLLVWLLLSYLREGGRVIQPYFARPKTEGM